MKINNIYKGWKTTIIGILFIIVGLGYVFYNSAPDYILMSILLSSGTFMLFSPDYFITKLLSFIGRKSKTL